MFSVESYDERGLGFAIDESLQPYSIDLPETLSLGKLTCGFGSQRGDRFLALYAVEGALWVQLETRRWPVSGSRLTTERRGEKHALLVFRGGAKVDELEYRPGWQDVPQEMIVADPDAGDEEFDLGCYIAERCAAPEGPQKLLRAWAVPTQ